MIFRINLYLKILILLKSLFISRKNMEKEIKKKIILTSKKKYFSLTSQLRISFLILLKYLKTKFPKKNEIIFLNYNLPEMPNVAKNLGYKLVFNQINKKNWFFNFDQLNKQINHKTLAVVLTNMFNSPKETIALKKICKKNKIILIEDNAISFDNFTKDKKGRKLHTGESGDYSLYSFNIMKNISALFGGGVSHNDKTFSEYINNEIRKYQSFPITVLSKQLIIYFLLKMFGIHLIYKYFFFHIVKLSHQRNIRSILKLFYPSLKFKVINFPKYYFSKISYLSIKLVYFQLLDINQRKFNFQKRLENNQNYLRYFKKYKIKNLSYLNIIDLNFQNPIDFPIMVKRKSDLIKFLLRNKVEVRSYYYRDCKYIFNKSKNLKRSIFENNLLCLPNHGKVNESYILKVVNLIKDFQNKN